MQTFTWKSTYGNMLLWFRSAWQFVSVDLWPQMFLAVHDHMKNYTYVHGDIRG